MTGADTRYDRNAPGQRTAGEPFVRYSSNEERLLSQALGALVAVDREAVRALQPVARGPLFPPRFIGPRTELGILQVFAVDRLYPDARAAVSGRDGASIGGPRP